MTNLTTFEISILRSLIRQEQLNENHPIYEEIINKLEILAKQNFKEENDQT
jgi:hypothetical protein